MPHSSSNNNSIIENSGDEQKSNGVTGKSNDIEPQSLSRSNKTPTQTAFSISTTTTTNSLNETIPNGFIAAQQQQQHQYVAPASTATTNNMPLPQLPFMFNLIGNFFLPLYSSPTSNNGALIQSQNQFSVLNGNGPPMMPVSASQLPDKMGPINSTTSDDTINTPQISPGNAFSSLLAMNKPTITPQQGNVITTPPVSQHSSQTTPSIFPMFGSTNISNPSSTNSPIPPQSPSPKPMSNSNNNNNSFAINSNLVHKFTISPSKSNRGQSVLERHEEIDITMASSSNNSTTDISDNKNQDKTMSEAIMNENEIEKSQEVSSIEFKESKDDRHQLEAIARQLLSSILLEQLQPELLKYVDNVASEICTANALNYHEKVFKIKREKVLQKRKQKQASETAVRKEATDVQQDQCSSKQPAATTDEQQQHPSVSYNSTTDVSDDESQPQQINVPIDNLRKSITKEWNEIRSEQGWRWDWLSLRIRQLEQELQSTNSELEDISRKKKKVLQSNSFEADDYIPSKLAGFDWPRPTLVSKPVFHSNSDRYSPQKRRKDINSHPVFSPDVSKTQMPAVKPSTKEELDRALLLYSKKLYIPSRKRKRPSTNLQLNIPPFQEKTIIEQRPTKRSRLSTQHRISKTPSSSRRGRQPGSARSVRTASPYDFDNIVVPWSELRSNFTIPEIKTKEIFTPQWRAADEEQYFEYFKHPQKRAELVVQYRQEDENKKDEDDSDEDTSDESYCNMHLPREMLERRRPYYYNSTPTTNRKKKKKDEQNEEESIDVQSTDDKYSLSATPIVSDKIRKEIHFAFVQHKLKKEREQYSLPPATSSKVSEAPATPVPAVPTRKTKNAAAKNDMLARWKHIEPETYIPTSSPALGDVKGNYDEMRQKHAAYEARKEQERRLREEQQPHKSHHRSHSRNYYANDIYYSLDDVIPSDDEFDYLEQSTTPVPSSVSHPYLFDDDGEDLSFLEDDGDFNDFDDDEEDFDDGDFVLNMRRRSTPSVDRRKSSQRGGARKKGRGRTNSFTPVSSKAKGVMSAMQPRPSTPSSSGVFDFTPLEGIWQCASVNGTKILLRRVDS